MLDINETPNQETSPDQASHPVCPPQVMTADEVAQLLRVNRKTVYAAFKAGEIPGGRRIGGTIRFCRERVLQWLADGQEGALRSPRGVR
jgi:excisionase family DNA binding protein